MVDDVGLDAAVGERGDHLQPERRGLDHDGRLHVVEDLVPLHGPADVLHVVETFEVRAGDAGVGVVEPGGHDQAVVADVALPLDRDRAGLRVERGDPCLVADVDALVDVGCFVARNSASKLGISLPCT